MSSDFFKSIFSLETTNDIVFVTIIVAIIVILIMIVVVSCYYVM